MKARKREKKERKCKKKEKGLIYIVWFDTKLKEKKNTYSFI